MPPLDVPSGRVIHFAHSHAFIRPDKKWIDIMETMRLSLIILLECIH